MDRRTFLALLGTPAIIALLDGCGGDEPSEVQMLRSSLARTPADPALAVDGARAVNSLGHDLYRWLAVGQPSGNLVCSPISIGVTMAMVTAGAVGPTQQEILAVLGVSDPAALHRGLNALTAGLDTRAGGDIELSLANSVWAQSGLTVGAPFLDVLAGEYGAGLETVDYRSDADGARAAINGWVDERTAGRIPELIADGVLDELTRLVLVNAIRLKAPWATPFPTGATQDRPFTLQSGEAVDVPTMSLTDTFLASQGDGWRAVELPFVDGELSMVVLLPEEGNLDMYQQTFLISESVDYFEPTYLRVQLPRFDVAATLSLVEPLGNLGIVTAFTDAADFSGITADEPLQLSAVVHQANITVDERGAEAAAATAAVARATSAPADDPVEFVVDRPFLVVIRDVPTGAMLFLGRVTDPRG